MIIITDRKRSIRPLPEQLDLACQAKPEMVILREKDMGYDDLLRLAAECLDVCERHDVPLAINSAMDVARELDICRIHIPFETMMREVPCDFSMVGVSVHTMYEAMKAEELGADYIILGHVFPTSSKDSKPCGLQFLRDVCDAVDIPVYAIGGVTPDNYFKVLSCGALGGCSMSTIMEAEDPASVIKRMSCVL